MENVYSFMVVDPRDGTAEYFDDRETASSYAVSLKDNIQEEVECREEAYDLITQIAVYHAVAAFAYKGETGSCTPSVTSFDIDTRDVEYIEETYDNFGLVNID